MLSKIKSSEEGNIVIIILAFFVVIVIGIWGIAVYNASQTLKELFAENKKLKHAITNLTKEDQIGYAKVVKQNIKDGKTFTTLKFVETARDDKNNKILTKKYTIEGDVIHFDALIIKFDKKMVIDRQQRSIYLWRRVYGETMPPSQGFEIEEEGEEPQRYKDFLEKRSFWDKILLKKDDDDVRFWNAIWDLSNDPEKLKKYGITAVSGNVVYKKLKPGLIYVFKITNTGHLRAETVPDM